MVKDDISDDESESSSEEEEDEKGALAPKIADSFLEILPKIASRHPDIYQDKKFFPGMFYYEYIVYDLKSDSHFKDEIEDDEDEEESKSDQEVVTYKDFVRKDILSKMDVEGSDSEEEEEKVVEKKPVKKKTHDEELQDLKKEFLMAAEGVLHDTDDEEDIYVRKEKTEEEMKEFENEYHTFLKQQEVKAKDDKTISTLAQFWTEQEGLNENEKFLRDFIINKRWLDKDTSANIELTKEINNIDIDEDEAALDNQEDFEHVYNFRYEEPYVFNIHRVTILESY